MRTVLLIVFGTLLTSGCVSGLLVRGVTWPEDPGRFWAVIRDTGLRSDSVYDDRRYFEGECTVVWNGTLMRGLGVDVRDDPRVRGKPSDGQSLNCKSSSLDIPSARVSWLSNGKGYFDLRVPKNERSGPQVFDTEGWPVILTLFGRRFGTSLFCTVTVKTESLTAVLNAGMDKDLHVYVGTGSRRCSFG